MHKDDFDKYFKPFSYRERLMGIRRQLGKDK